MSQKNRLILLIGVLVSNCALLLYCNYSQTSLPQPLITVTSLAFLAIALIIIFYDNRLRQTFCTKTIQALDQIAADDSNLSLRVQAPADEDFARLTHYLNTMLSKQQNLFINTSQVVELVNQKIIEAEKSISSLTGNTQTSYHLRLLMLFSASIIF